MVKHETAPALAGERRGGFVVERTTSPRSSRIETDNRGAGLGTAQGAIRVSLFRLFVGLPTESGDAFIEAVDRVEQTGFLDGVPYRPFDDEIGDARADDDDEREHNDGFQRSKHLLSFLRVIYG